MFVTFNIERGSRCGISRFVETNSSSVSQHSSPQDSAANANLPRRRRLRRRPSLRRAMRSPSRHHRLPLAFQHKLPTLPTHLLSGLPHRTSAYRSYRESLTKRRYISPSTEPTVRSPCCAIISAASRVRCPPRGCCCSISTVATIGSWSSARSLWHSISSSMRRRRNGRRIRKLKEMTGWKGYRDCSMTSFLSGERHNASNIWSDCSMTTVAGNEPDFRQSSTKIYCSC